VYALNLPLSPEKFEFWESADPVCLGAGETENTLKTSVQPTPRGLRQHRDVGAADKAAGLMG
jgi:hypothetical protein